MKGVESLLRCSCTEGFSADVSCTRPPYRIQDHSGGTTNRYFALLNHESLGHTVRLRGCVWTNMDDGESDIGATEGQDRAQNLPR